jgi:hypothetical protein
VSHSVISGVSPKDLRDLYQQALDLGCTAETSGGNHIKLRLPGGGSLCGPLTSSDRRSTLNMRSRLRRRGLAL